MGHTQVARLASLGTALFAVVASGCQSVPRSDYAAYPAYDYSNVSPAAGPAVPSAGQVAVPATSYNPAPYQALEANTIALKERLERVEKAMLRLDRRMQLVERNELGRMSSGEGNATTGPLSQGPSDEQVAMRALNLNNGDAPVEEATSSYRPVSARGETITSALQAATVAPAGGMPQQLASRNVGSGLPSLADPAPSSGRSLQPAAGDVAIWTVRYEPSKVWPDRAQLPASRDVVEALRQTGNVTLYARGKNANGVEFRERVKALSRYLSKVTSVESVPIAAMAAPHLDDETIEILATH